MSIISTSGASTSTPAAQEQRDGDLDAAPRIEREVDQIMAALAEPTATEAFESLVAEHGLTFEEWDTTGLDEKLRDKFFALYLEHKDGTRLLVVPTGQDPGIRLHAVRALLAHEAVSA